MDFSYEERLARTLTAIAANRAAEKETRRIKSRSYSRKWRQQNQEACRDASYRWREDNLELAQAINRKYYNTHKDKCLETAKAGALRRKYGLTTAKQRELFITQGSRCANPTCRTGDPGVSKKGKPLKWHTDHQPGTKIVRGILCWRCNLMLGHACDSPERLEGGAEYLRQHSNSTG